MKVSNSVKNRKRVATSTFAITVLILISGCGPENGKIVESESPSPTLSESPEPPERQDFTAEAAAALAWTDSCEVLESDAVVGQIASAEVESENSGVKREGTNGGKVNECTFLLDLPNQSNLGDIYIKMEIFDNNVDAFDHYYDMSVNYPQIFSDAEIDESFTVGENSAWVATQVTAQETPTIRSENRSMAVAVMLEDFYAVEVLVRIRPEYEAQIAECDPDADGSCEMTAVYMAEFLAASTYLTDLHERIEAAVGR